MRLFKRLDGTKNLKEDDIALVLIAAAVGAGGAYLLIQLLLLYLPH